jgi:hypothetical protein
LNPRRLAFELLRNNVRLREAGGVINDLRSSSKDASVSIPKTEVRRVFKERKHSIDASKEPFNDDAEASQKNVAFNLQSPRILCRFVPSDDLERRRVCRVRENVIVKQNTNRAEVQGGVAVVEPPQIWRLY